MKVFLQLDKNNQRAKIPLKVLSMNEISERLRSPKDENCLIYPFFPTQKRTEGQKKILTINGKERNFLITGNSCVGKSTFGAYLHIEALRNNEYLSMFQVSSKATTNKTLLKDICLWFHKEIEDSVSMKILINLAFTSVDPSHYLMENIFSELISQAKSK